MADPIDKLGYSHLHIAEFEFIVLYMENLWQFSKLTSIQLNGNWIRIIRADKSTIVIFRVPLSGTKNINLGHCAPLKVTV